MEETKKKIVVVGSSLKDKGGIVSVMNSISKSFLKNKYDFIKIDTYISGSVIRWIYMYCKSLFKIMFYCLFEKEINIYHIHMSYKGSFYRKSIIIIILSLFRKHIIMHMHGSESKEFYDFDGYFFTRYRNYIFSKVGCLIVLSKSWQKYFSKYIDEKRILVLPNCIKITNSKRNLEKIFDRKLFFLFLGRFGKRKGIYDYIKVIKKLEVNGLLNSEIHFYLGGDGEIEKVNSTIINLKLETFISNLGWVSGDVKEDLLNKCHIFVLPSYNEGLPVSILEAMSHKMIVISTNVGGIPEIISNDKNGFIITPGDIEQLYSCIKDVINFRSSLLSLSNSAFLTVKQNFNEERVLLELDRYYQTILK